jgi:carbon storage regulator
MIGDQIAIKVLRKQRNAVKLGIEAPVSVAIYRQEVYHQMQSNNRAAARRRTKLAKNK